VALPAYAPERRTVALLLLTAYQVLSSKPLSRGDGGVQMGQTDRQTDARPLQTALAYCAGIANTRPTYRNGFFGIIKVKRKR